MKAEFYYYKRKYTCCIVKTELSKELRIRNEEGEVIAIEQGKKFGFQGKKRENSKQVDVSQPYFYNLIKSAISALKIVEKNQLLLEKNQLIDIKDEKINILTQQLNIIDKNQILSDEQKQKLAQLQDAMQEQEAVIKVKNEHIAQLENQLIQSTKILCLEEIEKTIIAKLSNEVWRCLHPSSRRELCHTYRNYQLIKSDDFTGQVADYSTAGHPLGIVAEREILAPFFKELYQFFYTNSAQINVSANTFEIGGVTLRSKGKYTLGDLPALISLEWNTYIDSVLEQANIFPESRLFRTVFCSDNVTQTERQLIQQFLQQWQHPLSKWLSQGQLAASMIDQIRKLRNRVTHPDVMYLWQFNILGSLLVGSKNQKGVLQEIYANSNTLQNNSNQLKRGIVAVTPPSYLNVGIR